MKAVFTLWLATLALALPAQDLPVNATMPPPMRVPMPTLDAASVSESTPAPATTGIAPVATGIAPATAETVTELILTAPAPSTVSVLPAPAPGGNSLKSPALFPPPPPGLPVLVMIQAIPCNVDMAYRQKNVDCAASVLKGVLTFVDVGSFPEASLQDAQLRAGSSIGGQNLTNANRYLIDAVSRLQSGNWSVAHRELEGAYLQIEHLAQIGEYEKVSLRALLEFSEAAEDLSLHDNADAMEGFLLSYQDAQDPNTEAAALFAQAQAEISAAHYDHALQLLTLAYGQAGPNLKSSILLARVGVLASLNGYDNALTDAVARQAIENAQSGQQKAFATLLYAALVHNVDPARARHILDDAEALCNSDADWARNQRQAIEQYRQTWGG